MVAALILGMIETMSVAYLVPAWKDGFAFGILILILLYKPTGLFGSRLQIEAGRVTATHYLRGEGRLYIRVFPHKSITAIPAETRMGKGKGEPEYWAAVVKPGMILFEIAGVPQTTAQECLARVAYKMPFRCRFVHRRSTVG